MLTEAQYREQAEADALKGWPGQPHGREHFIAELIAIHKLLEKHRDWYRRRDAEVVQPNPLHRPMTLEEVAKVDVGMAKEMVEG